MRELEGTRTNTNLEHAFAECGRFDRRFLKKELVAEAMGYRELAALARTAARNGAVHAKGHLDLMVTDDADAGPSGVSPRALADEMVAMIDDHTAMYAGMARTAHDEGFEEISDWFETLARAGRVRARRLRHMLHEYGSDA